MAVVVLAGTHIPSVTVTFFVTDRPRIGGDPNASPSPLLGDTRTLEYHLLSCFGHGLLLRMNLPELSSTP